MEALGAAKRWEGKLPSYGGGGWEMGGLGELGFELCGFAYRCVTFSFTGSHFGILLSCEGLGFVAY